MHSYSSLYNLGHAAVADILKEDVIVEEKVDGSQISFTLTTDFELQMRSKGAQINVVAPEGMFSKGVQTVTELKSLLRPGWTYRGEYLAKPKHNVLNYDRTPKGCIILFDVDTGDQSYLNSEDKRAEAERIGLECVPELYRGRIEDPAKLRELLDTMSVLGGHKVEGVVIKPAAYNLFGRDKKCLMAKFVSEEFKETHARTWTKEHATASRTDVLALIATRYNTAARWAKARIHLEEAGKLEGSPRDIGLLIKEVPDDIRKECEDEIKQDLFDWAWPQLKRALVRGIPDWYKECLMKKQFEKDALTELVQHDQALGLYEEPPHE